MEFESLPSWAQTIVMIGAIAFALLVTLVFISSAIDCHEKGGVFIADSLQCAERVK